MDEQKTQSMLEEGEGEKKKEGEEKKESAKEVSHFSNSIQIHLMAVFRAVICDQIYSSKLYINIINFLIPSFPRSLALLNTPSLTLYLKYG